MKYLSLIVCVFSVSHSVDWNLSGQEEAVELWAFNRNKMSTTMKIYRRQMFPYIPQEPHIILKTKIVNKSFTHSIHYKIPKISELAGEKQVLIGVSKLWDIHRSPQTPQVPIIRETPGSESSAYKSFFGISNSSSSSNPPVVKRLYRLSFFNEDFHIQQVLPNYHELNSQDVFVLDVNSLPIYIFKMKTIFPGNSPNEVYIDEIKISAGFKLSNFINKKNRNRTIEFLTDVSSYETNIDPFFEHIETTTQINKAELIDFLRDKKSTNISEANFQLTYEFSELTKKNVISDGSQISNINDEYCYIFMKMAAKELFLYVGNMSTSARLSSALLLGEQLARQKNMMITIVQKPNLPTAFVTFFKNINDIFFKKSSNRDEIKMLFQSINIPPN